MKIWHISTAFKVIIVFVVLAALALLIPVRQSTINATGVLSAASIFYGILVGFFISGAMSNLGRLKTLVAIETGGLIAVYNSVVLALPEKLEEFRANVDNYLIKRFEYEIDEYTEPTGVEFFHIFSVLKGSNPASEGERAAMEYIAEGLYYIPQARREITIVGARIVSRLSWLVLSLLSLIIIISLYLNRSSSFDSGLITVLLSTTTVLVLMILADVDSNRFGEEHFAIHTYQAVFRALDLLPYYSKKYIEEHGYRPREKQYRSGRYGDVSIVDKRSKKERSA